MIETNGKRLYKSRRVRMIDGVCGGIAEYFDVDVTFIRLLFVLMTVMGGAGLIVYIAAMILMPINPDLFAEAPVARGKQDNRRFWGITLILVGAAFLLMNVGWFSGFRWWEISGKIMLPLLLIGVGIFLYLSFRSKRPATDVADDSGAAGDLGGSAGEGGAEAGGAATGASSDARFRQKDLRRSVVNRKLFGVCGGVADYFSVDATVVRLLFVLLVVASFGWGLLIYVLLGLLMPEEKRVPAGIL
jgi:phage shock protein C